MAPLTAITLQPQLASITIMGSGRIGPTLTALIGLVGAAIGGLALARSRRLASHPEVDATSGRGDANTAIIFGAISVVLGAIFINLVQNGMNLARIESYLQIVVIGVLLILAVVADQLRQRVMAKLHD